MASPIQQRREERIKELTDMGLVFKVDAYVGNEEHNKDFNFPLLDINYDNESKWESTVRRAKLELKRRTQIHHD